MVHLPTVRRVREQFHGKELRHQEPGGSKSLPSPPLLGSRLLACCQALLALEGKSASQIFGSPDDRKLRSSLTLFSLVPDAPSEFGKVLAKFYAGHPDPRTLELLKQC